MREEIMDNQNLNFMTRIQYVCGKKYLLLRNFVTLPFMREEIIDNQNV